MLIEMNQHLTPKKLTSFLGVLNKDGRRLMGVRRNRLELEIHRIFRSKDKNENLFLKVL